MPNLQQDKQRQFALEVVRKLRDANFEAYWAGGCVRDQLLQRQVKDYDVATSATPQEVRELFGQRRTLQIGAAFGVVSILGPRKAGQVEVATFRQDATYSDGRHPDSVAFSSAEEDAKRRDFTINGLFYDPIREEVIDYIGGQKDLTKKILRAIGDPAQRLSDDKLRMLRAVRFTASLDFAMDADTFQAINQMAPEITVVSAERIAAELRLILTDQSRAQGAQLLRDSGLLANLLPSNCLLPAEDVWKKTLTMLDDVHEPGFSLALALMTVLWATPAEVRQICANWKLSNKESELAVWLVEHERSLDDVSTAYWPDVQRILIRAGILDLLGMLQARVQVGLAKQDDLLFCRQRLDWPTEKLNPNPLISGDDLMSAGIPTGAHYQTLLKAARDAQLLGEIHTKQEAMKLIQRCLKKLG